MTTQNLIVINETLYDSLGRSAVSTVAAAKGAGAISPSAPVFEPDFVASRSGNNPVFQGQALTGQIQQWVDRSSFLKPSDPDYAYTGQIFSPDPLSQIQVQGSPGVQFNLDSAHALHSVSGLLNTQSYTTLHSHIAALSQSVLQTQFGLGNQNHYLGQNGNVVKSQVSSFSGLSGVQLAYGQNEPDVIMLSAAQSSLGAAETASQLYLKQSQRFLPNYFSTLTSHESYMVKRYQDAAGNLISKSSPDIGQTNAYYDAANRLRFTQNADQATLNNGGVVIYYLYDALSRMTEVGYFNSAWNPTSFAALCLNLASTPQPASAQILQTRHYDTDPNGSIDASLLGRLVQIQSWQTTRSNSSVTLNENGQVTQTYSYDASGRVTALTETIQGQDYTSTYAYDSLSRLAQLGYPDGTSVQYRYNPQGQVSQITGSGFQAVYTYHVDGSIATETFGNDLMRSYTYGNTFGQLTRIADSQGLFTETLDYTRAADTSLSWLTLNGSTSYASISDSKNVLNFNYNQDFTVELWLRYTGSSAPTQQLYLIQKWGGNTYPYVIRLNTDCTLQAARYDGTVVTEGTTTAVNSLSKVNDGQYHHVAFVRKQGQVYLYLDGVLEGTAKDNTTRTTTNTASVVIGKLNSGQYFPGDIGQVRIWNIGLSAAQVGASRYSQEAGPQPALAGYWPFNGDGSDLSQNHQNATVSNVSYTQHAISRSVYQDGNIQSAGNTYGSAVTATTSAYDYSYDYDAFGRLSAASATLPNSNASLGSAWQTQAVSYDANGNKLTLNEQQWTYNPGTDRLKQVGSGPTYLYTDNGLTTATGSGVSLSYDVLNRRPVTAAKGVSNVVFVYRADGERVYKQSGNDSITYIRGLSSFPLQEVEQNGTATQYYYGPAGLVALKTPTSTYYLLKDHLGSSRVLYDANSNEVSDYYSYNAYGQLVEGNQTGLCRYLYTGQEYDGELELYNYHARQYDPGVSLFLSPDPDHQFANPYNYVMNNPINAIDLTGDVMTLTFWNTQHLTQNTVPRLNELSDIAQGSNRVFLCELYPGADGAIYRAGRPALETIRGQHRRLGNGALYYGGFIRNGRPAQFWTHEPDTNLGYGLGRETRGGRQQYRGGQVWERISQRNVLNHSIRHNYDTIDVFVYHANAQIDSASRNISYIVRDLQENSNNDWILLGDMNIEPAALLARHPEFQDPTHVSYHSMVHFHVPPNPTHYSQATGNAHTYDYALSNIPEFNAAGHQNITTVNLTDPVISTSDHGAIRLTLDVRV